MRIQLSSPRLWALIMVIALVIQGVVMWQSSQSSMTHNAAQTNFARIWPYIDQLEYEGDDAQQGRALRWAPMAGTIRLPDAMTAHMRILELNIHTGRTPSQPLHVQIHTSASPTEFDLAPGWRRVLLLTAPSSAWQPYDEIPYTLSGELLSTRRDLGIAVSRVDVDPTVPTQIDWQRALFVLMLWLWLVPIGITRRVSPLFVFGAILLILASWWFFATPLGYVLPNQWALVGYIWLMTALVVLDRYRQPRLVYWMSLAGIVVAVGLWQLGFGWVGVLVITISWFFAKPWPEVAWPESESRDSLSWTLGIVIVAVVVAGFLRIVQLDEFPAGLFRDEARHGWLSNRILAGEYMVYSPVANLPAGYFYLSALPISLFGTSAWSIRIIAALVGTGSVLVLFWMLSSWWGTNIAMWSAVVLATFLWHVGLSRIGFPATLGPLLTMIAVGSWVRLFKSDHPWRWAMLAGIATGLMLMVYHSARLMPLVVAVTIIGLLWLNRWPLRRFLVPILMYAVVTLIVASPMLWYAISQPDNYMRRIGVTSIMADATLRGLPVWLAIFNNIQAYIGMLFVAGDTNPRHFNLGAPQLQIAEAVGFVVGVVWLHHTKPIWLWWLFAWLGIALLSGVLSVDAPHALRTVEAIVPIVILIGAGFYRLTRVVAWRWQLIIISLVLFGTATWSAFQYSTWQTHPRTQSRFDTNASNDVRFVQALARSNIPATTKLYVPERMRRSDLGVYLLEQTGVRAIGNEFPSFNPALQHILLLSIDTPPPRDAVALSWLPVSMQDRYALWCVGACQSFDWYK